MWCEPVEAPDKHQAPSKSNPTEAHVPSSFCLLALDRTYRSASLLRSSTDDIARANMSYHFLVSDTSDIEQRGARF